MTIVIEVVIVNAAKAAKDSPANGTSASIARLMSGS
jgi:hypothetical protein